MAKSKIKDLINIPEARREYFLAGNSTCQGCGLDMALRWAMKALGQYTVTISPASCSNVVTGVWPKSAPDWPWFNMAFAGATAAATGMKHGLITKGKGHYNVVVWAGDGGTTDIGLQGLSGAAERNEDIIYVCYDNEAYQNTGNQRSSSTPHGVVTTTTPYGKEQHKKNLPMIVAAHNVPYVATASVSDPMDLYDKFKKAKDIKGFRYIQILSPCPPGWRSEAKDTIQHAQMAIDCGIFPLYEIENGKLTLNGKSVRMHDKTKRKPLGEYFNKKNQGRFKKVDEEVLKVLQEDTDKWWAWIDRHLVYQEEAEL
ncbi:Pyruvate synthase subunit PorB [Candidatus Lokiarchaeum ossiferum]|uniref:Pyruvate synthase subunit PorB n=1 Tax=Candidatus Lokiarchaeum ossiferum TaxID=2951803 RepID=A0ABY6HTD5_9ARCH|nr:Pyruvate synthase subunit PorB [Candidatus Lokiarchaeum sp. B-35]